MRRSTGIFIALLLIAGLGATLIAPPVAASSSTTWTSTADFDGGDKGDPGPIWFAEGGIDQPMNWINYPAAVYANGRTYIVWQGDTTYAPYIAYYDHATGAWSTKVRIRNDNPLSLDSHGAPALAIGPNGYLHVFCCSHDTSLLYSRSTNPYDITSWDSMTSPAPTSTYPHPVFVGSTLYLFYRNTNANFGPWAYRTSTTNGASWSGATTFFADFGYFGGTELYGNQIHLTWVNDSHPSSTNRLNAYEGYLNTADGNMYCKGNPSDTNLGTTISQAEADASCRVENTGASMANFGAVHLDASGNPYVIYGKGTTLSSTDWNYRFSRWTGSAWTAPANIRSTDNASNYGDFIVHSSTDIEAYLLSAGLTTSISGAEGGTLERWLWNGATWTLGGTTLSHGRAGQEVAAPVVPLNHAAPVEIVADHRISGTSTNTLAMSRLFAYGDSGFVGNSALSAEPSVQTSTDNPAITAGQIELFSGKADTFALADADANTTLWNSFWRPWGTPGPLAKCAAVAVTGGILSTLITAAQGSECGVSSSFTISGNWDVRVKVDVIQAGSSYQRDLCIYSRPSECSNTPGNLASDENGFFYRFIVSNQFAAFNVSGGTVTQVGTNSLSAIDPGWLRITRSGTTFTFFYSSDGSAWTQDEQFTRGDAPSSYYVTFVNVDNGVTDSEINFDDYLLASGTVDPGGYRASGSWTSPAQTTSGATPVSIGLEYSGASATTYIDKLEILDANGNALFTDDTDRNSGTSASVVIQDRTNLQPTWSVRVTLAGDGSSTIALESVTVNLDTPPAQGGVGNRGVHVDCRITWPVQNLECVGWVDQWWKDLAGGLKESWFVVDGLIVLQNGTLSLPLGDDWYAPAVVSHQVTFIARSHFGISAASLPFTAILEKRPLWFAPFLFTILVLGAISRFVVLKQHGKPEETKE